MRLSKGRVTHMAEAIARRLEADRQIELLGERSAFLAELERVITDELTVEDRLNAEIRELMKKYEREIESGHVDYQKMFTMIKSKLVRERGLIL